MADTTDNDTRRLAEIRARVDAASPGPWQMDGVRVTASRASGAVTGDLVAGNAAFVAHARDDIPYLLDLVAALDREIAELQGLLADLCEDSRAAAAAVRYRRALEEIAAGKVSVDGESYPILGVDVADVARAALEDETR